MQPRLYKSRSQDQSWLHALIITAAFAATAAVVERVSLRPQTRKVLMEVDRQAPLQPFLGFPGSMPRSALP